MSPAQPVGGCGGRRRAMRPKHIAREENMTDTKKTTGLSRRKFLKTTGAAAGAAAGSGVIGAPMIWAQNISDVTLNWVGPSYSVISDIADQASKDLGFKIVPQMA